MTATRLLSPDNDAIFIANTLSNLNFLDSISGDRQHLSMGTNPPHPLILSHPRPSFDAPPLKMNIGYGGEDCVISPSFSFGHEKGGIRYGNEASIWRNERPLNADPTHEYGIIRRTLSNSISSSVRTLERTPLKYLTCIMVLSWLAAAYTSASVPGTISDLQHRVKLQRRMVEDSRQALKSLQERVMDEKNFVKNLEVTHQLLSHEVRLTEELAEGDYEMTPPPLGDEGKEMIQIWLEHRQEGLEKRLMQLQRYVQDASRQEAIRKYVSPSLLIPLQRDPRETLFLMPRIVLRCSPMQCTDLARGRITFESP
jgi:hypothetical protein